MAKIGRNEPCPCGSNKKYKKCHLNREDQPIYTDGEVKGIASSHKIKKKCFHPLASKNTCKGKIINAHTVSKSSSLKKIAKNGKVLHFKPEINSLFETEGKFIAKEVGVNQASTFPGFCQHHDREMFAPIEDVDFESSAYNCFLLGYRALTKEIYAKSSAIQLTPKIRELDRGRDPSAQVLLQSLVSAYDAGLELGMRDLRYYKENYDSAFKEGNFSDTYYYVIKFSETPNILYSGAIYPEFDLEGNELQILGSHRRYDCLSINAIALSSGGAVVFQWMGKSLINEQLISSLHRLKDCYKASALTQFAFESFENLFINPSWWEKIEELHTHLEKKVMCGTNMQLHDSKCFIPDENFYYHWGSPVIETNLNLTSKST